MTDIVERLRAELEDTRHAAKSDAAQIAEQARVVNIMAAEIERLRAENIRLQEALAFDPKEMQAEIERLLAALNRISALECGVLDPNAGLAMFEIARDIARQARTG
jgi:hypothetical protein